MKLLIKFPSRERPEKFRRVIKMYSDMANGNDISFLISIDEDDPHKEEYLTLPLDIRHKYDIKIGHSKSKVEAINADVNEYKENWDILLLASDDMAPQIQGWDEVIIRDMKISHSDLDGVLYYYDGFQDLNTMPIMGRKYYERYNYIYNPNFISLWCDNYFQDQAEELGKQTKFNKEVILFKHEHWGNGKQYNDTIDDLMRRNERYFWYDERTYRHLKGMMTIDYAIMSSDDSDYLNYWEPVKKAWKKIGVQPLLFHVTNREEGIIYNEKGNPEIIYLKLIEGVKPSLQAQISRIWAYKYFSIFPTTTNAITTDIDMMPLSRPYFIDNMKKYTDDHIISYCSDAAPIFDGYQPMCYILSNVHILSSLIKHNTWEEFVRDLADKGGQGWSTDQWHITNLINQYDQNKVVKLNRGWNQGGGAMNRLDRCNWEYENEDIKSGKVYDAHLLRPCNNFENERLLKLINLI